MSDTVLAWNDGEHERWAARAAVADHGLFAPEWEDLATRAGNSIGLSVRQLVWLFLRGPEDLARPLLGSWNMDPHRGSVDLAMATIARFELDALPLALAAAGADADRFGLLIMPFAGPEPATLAASWLRNLGSSRLWARMWLTRHPAAAERALTPIAAGKAGRARQNAEDALRFLAGTTPTTRGYEPEHPVTAGTPSTAPATRPVKIPDWAVPAKLPLIVLRGDGAGTLPEASTAALLTALTEVRLADAPEPPPGSYDPVEAVDSSAAAQPIVVPARPAIVADCDPRSLAEFGWALFEGWVEAGLESRHAWALLGQAWLADDETLGRLAPLIRSWPARSRFARAIDGFAVLATVGSDASLRLLHEIEAGMSGGPTNDRATTYLRQAAAARGLTPPELADRLAPTLGLDDGVVLDYGTRRLTAHLDATLTPYVADETGRRLTKPPRPGARDLASGPARFSAFRRESRAATVQQTARLEQDMLTGRWRTAGHLRRHLLPHPLLGPIGQRLLWMAGGMAGGTALRIAEDGTFADVYDNTVTLAEDAPVRLAHPALLGADTAIWAATFLDYEIMQPFAQLDRPLATPDEVAGRALPADRIMGLERYGWRRAGDDHHRYSRLTRLLPHGLTLVADVSPGFPVSVMPSTPDQTITELWVDRAWSDHWPTARRIPFSDADPVTLSEALVGLREAL
ncbi:DUF4132 domain-containing protein [Catenuloplanes sp. NPDC051500]|uniref:DUF4132 domain-containing protein n=1 Tax=Catenuloplanes sp. NPDC051500 TaxID=3363959 RepID=UPI0037BC1894